MNCHRLIITRHGESIWNKLNKFTGWSNIELTKKGIEKSKNLSKKLIKYNYIPNKIYTSNLIRSIQTSEIIKNNIQNNNNINIVKSWRLNERHYGILEGLNRDYAYKIYGNKTINTIRKKYYYMPYIFNNQPIIDYNIICNNNNENLVIGESINMVYKRLLPLWDDQIKADLLKNNNLLIVSHKNTIKALMKIVEELNINEVENLDIKNSELIIYNFDNQLKLLDKEILN